MVDRKPASWVWVPIDPVLRWVLPTIWRSKVFGLSIRGEPHDEILIRNSIISPIFLWQVPGGIFSLRLKFSSCLPSSPFLLPSPNQWLLLYSVEIDKISMVSGILVQGAVLSCASVPTSMNIIGHHMMKPRSLGGKWHRRVVRWSCHCHDGWDRGHGHGYTCSWDISQGPSGLSGGVGFCFVFQWWSTES